MMLRLLGRDRNWNGGGSKGRNACFNGLYAHDANRNHGWMGWNIPSTSTVLLLHTTTKWALLFSGLHDAVLAARNVQSYSTRRGKKNSGFCLDFRSKVIAS